MKSVHVCFLICTVVWMWPLVGRGQSVDTTSKPADIQTAESANQVARHKTAILAGGCFWSLESDFAKLPGVVDITVGYSGGRSKNPTYATYASKGHREAIFIAYDPERITFRGLIEYFIKHIDPTDRSGSFVDRGRQYSPAIYVADDQEKQAAEEVIAAINRAKVFRRPIAVPILARVEFWPAEPYHQDYHLHHHDSYQQYRASCGRDSFIMQHWGLEASRLSLPGSVPSGDVREEESEGDGEKGDQNKSPNELSKAPSLDEEPDKPWEKFRKPSVTELKKKLTKIQLRVTQSDQTEPPFLNEFWDHHEEGIYVDVVSGEPLFASTQKFESGTGWPSFVRPIENRYLVYQDDYSQFPVRTEVRSKFGDSHLGHVFHDGPPDRGGLRYCMNSAALRFVPRSRMQDEGYGMYIGLLRQNAR
jgi:peptide methionine sulfoxide reductase msrA/msrB